MRGRLYCFPASFNSGIIIILQTISSKMKPSRPTLIAILLLSLILVIYNIARIVGVSITHDEVITPVLMQSYGHYITMSQVTANNHILNSVLRKFFIELFGNYDLFTVRLDSLLAQLAFLAFSYLLLKRLFAKNAWLLAGFLLLNLNPFMFDFWGLSRGYGLSLAFMMGGIYFLVSYIQLKRPQHLWLYLLMGILAVWSNFALLNFYVASIAVLMAEHVLFFDRNKLKIFLKQELATLALMSFAIYLLVGEPIRKLRESNELYYGGDAGLMKDTLYGLVRETFSFHFESPYIAYVSYVVIVSLLLTSIYWPIAFIKNRHDDKTRVGILLWLLLMIPLCSIKVQHKFLHTKYLIDRTALFLIVLYILQLIYSLYCLSYYKKWAATVLICIITFLFTGNFIKSINTDHTQMWLFDRYDTIVLDKMLKESKNKKDKITVRTDWIFAPSFIYYWEKKYKGRFKEFKYIKEKPGGDTSYDYYYLLRDDTADISSKYLIDTTFFEGWSMLLKKKE